MYCSRLSPKALFQTLVVGVIVGIDTVGFEISLASLIFSGALVPHLATGVGVLLFGTLVIGLVTALRSSLRGIVAGPQDIPAVMLALAAAGIAGRMEASAGSEAVLVTVLACMALTTLLGGAFFWLLGRFRLGELVRYLPYPVIGGILGGVGWILVSGAFETMLQHPLNLDTLPRLLAPAELVIWLPGLALGLALFVVMERYSHFLLITGLLLGSVALFYLILYAHAMPVSQAMAAGWLLGPFPEGDTWQPVLWENFSLIDWRAVFSQAGIMSTVIVFSAVALLINSGGLEVAARRDIDVNEELRATGIANLLAGLGGSSLGFSQLGPSVVIHKLGAGNRLTGIVMALVYALSLGLGLSVLSYLPRLAIGGLLLFYGLDLLYQWVYRAWFKLPKTEYLISLLVLAAITGVGFLEGVGIGIVAAVILFALNYSRVRVVHNALSGAVLQSNFDRPPQQRKLLKDMGERIYILKLRGYLFFGTANELLALMRARLADTAKPPLGYLALDFRQVQDIDSTTFYTFGKMQQLAEEHGVMLALAELPANVEEQFRRGELLAEGGAVRRFPDLDRALEACENHLLQSLSMPVREQSYPLRQIFDSTAGRPGLLHKLDEYFERLEVPAGYQFIHQGEPANDMFYIESGLAEVRLELSEGKTTRLRSLGPGSFTGEIGMFVGEVRSASVIMVEPGALYRLSREGLERMETETPQLARELEETVIRLLAERLTVSSRIIRTLLE